MTRKKKKPTWPWLDGSPQPSDVTAMPRAYDEAQAFDAVRSLSGEEIILRGKRARRLKSLEDYDRGENGGGDE